jgi:HK97 family phage portal protein
MGLFDKFTAPFKTKGQSSVFHSVQMLGNSQDFVFNKDKGVVKTAYWINGDVYSITSRIARNAANIPRLLFRKTRSGTGELELVTEGELYDLINKSPNSDQTSETFRQEALINLLTRGNSFAFARRPTGFETIGELHNLYNDTVTVNCTVKDFRPKPSQYSVEVAGRQTKFPVEDIMHIKYNNPSPNGFETCLGLSPLQAGMLSLIFSTDTKKAQSQLIKTQGGRGFLTNRSENALTDSDKLAIQRAQDMRIEGAKNFNKLIATSANIDFVSTAMDANQLKTIESSVLSKRDLCDLYSVDSSLFNDPANKTYNNRKEAEKAMFTNAVIPLNDMDIAAWMNFVVPAFNEADSTEYIIKQDLSVIPSLAVEETEKSKKALNETKIITSILTSEISSIAKSLSLQRTLNMSEEDANQYLTNESE